MAKFGDPLMDLVGVLAGGVFSGLEQWGAGDELEQTTADLLATPRKIEKPRYAHYHFSRAEVRSLRKGTLPITLTDLTLEKSWQVKLKRREVRDLTVVQGLDPRDRQCESHSRGSLTDDGFRQWLAEPPVLSLADMARGLLDRPSAAPIDRLAQAAVEPKQAESRHFPGDAAMDAAVLPRPRLFDDDLSPLGGGETTVLSRGVSASAGTIAVIGETGRTEGGPRPQLRPFAERGGRHARFGRCRG